MQDNAILLDIEPEPMEVDKKVEIMEVDSNEDLCLSIKCDHVNILRRKGKLESVMLEGSGTIPLHLAILHSHIDAIKDVLEGGAHVNARNNVGETALHIAAGADQLETTKLLLKHGADVKAETNLKLTSLHIAVRNGNAKLAKFLTLHCYSMIDSSDHTGNTPLYDAVKSGNLEIVKILLMADADPNTRNNDGDSPFLLALTMGKEDLVLELMKYGAKVEQKTAKAEGAMHLACRYCNCKIISILRRRKLSVHSVTLDGSSTLHYAVMNKDYKLSRSLNVRKMLKFGVKPDVVDNNNCSPIMIAVKNKDEVVIHELMNYGASLSIADSRTGLTPLLMALKQGSFFIAQQLMNKQCLSSQHICDHNQENALHLAIKHFQGDDRWVLVYDLMHNSSVDVKQRSLENKTPVDLALETKDQELIYYMLDAVDLDGNRDILDFNALLMIAINYSDVAKVSLMLRKGAQAENPCFILEATEGENRSILRKLIKCGADVNAVDTRGNSILERAIRSQLKGIVDLFLLFGADVNRVNRGRTPLMLATHIMKKHNYTMESSANVQILLRQIVLMQHQGKFVHELNRQVIQESRFTDSKKFTTVIETYNKVLENMRTMPVTDDTSTTYYDLIVRPNSTLIRAYAGNAKLREAARTCKKRFVLPEFSDVLQFKYAQYLQRKKMVSVVRPSLHEIFRSKLPYELTCQIVDYMSNNDMRRYVKLASPKIERNRQLDW